MTKFVLLFFAIFLGGVWAALFYDSSIAFALYQIVYFIDPKDRWWGHQIPNISYSFLTSVLMISVLAIRYRKLSEKSPWGRQPVFKWIVAILVLYYLAFMWALVPDLHSKFTFIFLKLIVVIFVAYKLLGTEKALKYSMWAYLLGCTYIGYLATITGRNSGNRLEGIFLPDSNGANTVAATLVPAGAMLLYFLWTGNKKQKLLCLVCGGLIANGLVLFNSRGAFVGTVLSAGLYLFFMMFSRYRQKGQRGLAVIITLLVIGGGLYVTDAAFWHRMATMDNLHSKKSGASRIVFWLTTFKMLKDHPLGLGIRGYNSISRFYLTKAQRGNDGREKYRAVHSLWFQGLSEIGWQGLFCFLAMLYTLYRLSRRTKLSLLKKENYNAYFKILALECSLFGYLITGSFINQFRAEILYWMILLVAVGTNIYYLQPKAEEEVRLKHERALAKKQSRLRGPA